MVSRYLPIALLFAACGHPGYPDGQVGYRRGLEPGEPNSGERGDLKISEILWSGSVTDDGTWDASDVFIEVRNEGEWGINLSGWYLVMEGTAAKTWRFPQSEFVLDVGQHAFVAAKNTGCFPEPDWVVPDLGFPYGDPFRVTLKDADERLIEPAGSKTMPVYAGGYDGVSSRSMEKVELMFGGRGSAPESWHYYTRAPVDVPNQDHVRPDCRTLTGASPGHPNSPDYSGAFASGSYE